MPVKGFWQIFSKKKKKKKKKKVIFFQFNNSIVKLIKSDSVVHTVDKNIDILDSLDRRRNTNVHKRSRTSSGGLMYVQLASCV